MLKQLKLTWWVKQEAHNLAGLCTNAGACVVYLDLFITRKILPCKLSSICYVYCYLCKCVCITLSIAES